MKIQFLTASESDLAARDSSLLEAIKAEIHARTECIETTDPEQADAIVLPEAASFKEWRYVDKLLADPVVGRFPHKTYTINTDDSSAGLLRGLYTSLGAHRFDARFHRAVPYASGLNERVLARSGETRPEPKFLASWRGNTKSNRVRRKCVMQLAGDPRFQIEATDSWFNHAPDEKEAYADLLLASKFSLCPAGWASVSFRIYESMALGIAPVVLADNFVPPAGPDWDSFALVCKEHQLPQLKELLERHEGDYLGRGRAAKSAWDQFFRPQIVHSYFADALLDCIGSAPRGSREDEIRRWTSFRMRWVNHWTVPQRLANKLIKLRE